MLALRQYVYPQTGTPMAAAITSDLAGSVRKITTASKLLYPAKYDRAQLVSGARRWPHHNVPAMRTPWYLPRCDSPAAAGLVGLPLHETGLFWLQLALGSPEVPLLV